MQFMDIKTFFRFRKEDFTRETYFYFVLAIVFTIAALGGLALYLYYAARGIAEPDVFIEKTLEERQLEQLDKLRKDVSLPEYDVQIGELNALKKGGKAPSQEELNNQLEELNKLSK